MTYLACQLTRMVRRLLEYSIRVLSSDVTELLAKAVREGKKVGMRGTQHSMGGHSIC